MASLARPTLLRQLCTVQPGMRMASSFARASTPLIRQPVKSAFVRDALPMTRIAAFHATSRQQLLPPLPQKIPGTVNDPVPVPDPTPAHGSYHWTFERLVSVGLIPLCVAPFAGSSLNPAMDATLCALLLLHSHIGFESMIIDYIPINRLPTARKVFMWLLKIATVLVGVGLYEFETNDVGITEAVKRIWHA